MRKNKPIINKAESNIDKHLTYSELNKRKMEALKIKDYISVIHYSYAMIEDRLLSFLHYLYITDRNIYPYKLEPQIEASLTKLLYPKSEKDTSSPRIKNISTKIDIIKKIYNYKKDDSTILLIKRHLEKVIDIKCLKKDISSLISWNAFRCEIVHSLYNKNLKDLEDKIEEQANIGIYLSEQFDKYSDLLKGNIYEVKSLRSKFEENNMT